MIDALDIGYAIKERRAQLGLTQARVAERSGVSKRCLWSLELGQNPGVQFNKLTAVFETLGLELNIEIGEVPSNNVQEASVKKDSAATYSPENLTDNSSVNNEFNALAILTGATR